MKSWWLVIGTVLRSNENGEKGDGGAVVGESSGWGRDCGTGMAEHCLGFSSVASLVRGAMRVTCLAGGQVMRLRRDL